jgi:hypothetical protein
MTIRPSAIRPYGKRLTCHLSSIGSKLDLFEGMGKNSHLTIDAARAAARTLRPRKFRRLRQRVKAGIAQARSKRLIS